ncbi:glycosyl hydrolase 108 family protein [Novosphingobium sp. ST904]|uniref:glycoside hydrolase family 108 protein n=2 Tax=Novosphingobium sp. ST904 TaxID=1684385 RepID=UPI001050E6B4|nr:glycosyl hydrolase 108 family protein [Novosphingobium sp. ST904]TCM40115.1 putative peptidoglycan binding protein [Novosphingobium sp. ST904]
MARKTLIRRGGTAASALALILGGVYAVEGGYVNHKDDRGGPTHSGVTQVVARQNGYLGDMRNFPRNCNATATVCADKIYTEMYVSRPGFYPLLTLDPGVAAEVIDTGINMGPAIASRFLQTAINANCAPARLTVDGKVGRATIAAYSACQRSIGAVTFCTRVLGSLDAQQEQRYRRIVQNQPSQAVFLKGWIAHRIGNVDRASCQ